MNQIPVIESDPIVFEQIRKLLAMVKSDLEAIHFKTSDEFSESINASIKQQNHERLLAIDKIPLIIADVDASKDVTPALWDKILKYISDHQSNPTKTPPRLILTAHQNDHHDRNLASFVSLSVFTLLIKPIDELLFTQNIQLALDPPGPLRPREMFTQKEEALIEIVKEIEIDRVTEIGFRTLSRRPIPLGKISRYFGPPFEETGGASVFAYCYANEADPNDPRLYLSSFSYFGISRERLHVLRAHIARSKYRTNQPLAGQKPTKPVTALLLSADEGADTVAHEIADRFENLNLITVKSLAALITCLPERAQKKYLPQGTSPSSKAPFAFLDGISIVLLDRGFCDAKKLQDLKDLIGILNEKTAQKATFVSLSSTPITSYAQLEVGSQFADILLMPLDFFYATRKLKILEPTLVLNDEHDQSNFGIPLHAGLKAAMPVKISELSETHVSIIYNRAIEIGKIRRFVLWIPNTKLMPEILGVCRHTEKLDANRFRCDFLYFGLSDHELKYARLWIIERYIHEKEKNSGT